ncbi:SH3 domain-containing protein [Devosia sp. A449]
MRKLFWVLAGLMALGALGNIIGGTDTPVIASTNPAAVQAAIPTAPAFEATMFVSASSLNLREAPTSGARVLTTLPRNTPVRTGERRGGWVQVSVNGRVGWVSDDYLGATPIAPALSVPVQSQPRQRVVQQPQNAASCPSRRYCTEISSCQEARFYLANCSWGSKLDGDGDGVPCEKLCR